MELITEELQPTPASQIPTPEAIVRSYYTLVDAQDFSALVKLFAPEAVYRRPGYAPFIGRKALAEFYVGERVIEEGRHDIADVIVAGRKVAVSGTFIGRVRSGKTVDLRFADFFTLNEEGHFATRDTFFFAPLV